MSDQKNENITYRKRRAESVNKVANDLMNQKNIDDDIENDFSNIIPSTYTKYSPSIDCAKIDTAICWNRIIKKRFWIILILILLIIGYIIWDTYIYFTEIRPKLNTVNHS